MIHRVARTVAVTLVALALAACTEAPRAHVAVNADEKLADDVMDALLKDDMRPVVDDFVPERKADLSSPKKVKQMHDFIRSGGAFLGARELRPPDPNSTIRYLAAAFAGGDVALTMTMDGHGKIVHYHLGGALSNP